MTSCISNPPYNLKHKLPPLASFMDRYMGWTLPPESNANYSFILTGLSMMDNRLVMILPNGVLTTGNKEEQKVRQELVDANLLLAVIMLPKSMFESTSIPVCIMVFDRNKQTKRIAMIDLTNSCEEEVRDQRGQFGGNAHTGRTYHKTINVIPEGIMERCVQMISDGTSEKGLCEWVDYETIKQNDYNLVPKRYFAVETEIKHRPFEDIVADFNRVMNQKNEIKIKMNKTAAKRLGYDCLDTPKVDLTESFAIVGQKPIKEDFISFGADDGIKISISTKERVHPLIFEFLKQWRQMIIYLNNEENRLLAEFRDALLPELMSGKIEVNK